MNDFEKNIDFENIPLYHCLESAWNGGGKMTAKEALAAALVETGKTQAEAASSISWTPQQLSQRLVRNSLRADEFLNLMDGIGIVVTFSVAETGKEVKAHVAGHGRRLKGMADRAHFDTAGSDALANSFYEDGVNEYTDGRAQELYIDKEGRYFMAEYTNVEGEKDRIRTVQANVAAAFIEKYGTTIEKAPV